MKGCCYDCANLDKTIKYEKLYPEHYVYGCRSKHRNITIGAVKRDADLKNQGCFDWSIGKCNDSKFKQLTINDWLKGFMM